MALLGSQLVTQQSQPSLTWLKGASGKLDCDEPLEFRNPDPAGLQIRSKGARGIGGHMTAHAAFFLGHTTAVNCAPFRGL